MQPTYEEINITCSCGNTFITCYDMNVAVYVYCRPFYKNRHKIVNCAGQVDESKRRYRKK